MRDGGLFEYLALCLLAADFSFSGLGGAGRLLLTLVELLLVMPRNFLYFKPVKVVDTLHLGLHLLALFLSALQF